MVRYEIAVSKQHYFPQEPVVLSLHIVNGGSTELDLPNPLAAGAQPVFLIAAGGAPAPETLAASSLHANAMGAGPVAPRIRIAPGGEWKGSLTLPVSAGISIPGDYRIASRFDEGASPIESQAVPVTVEKFHPELAAAGYGVEPLGAADGQLLFLQGGRALYKTRYIENRPSIAETTVDPPTLVEVLPGDAADIGLPLRNTSFYDEVEQWMVWRQQQQIHLRSSLGDNSSATRSGVVRLGQPLKLEGGAIQVFAVTDAPPAVTQLLFPPSPGAPVSPGWRLPLDGPAAGITAALGPGTQQAEGHVAVVSAAKDGAVVEHVHYVGFRIPDAFNSVTIPGCEPVHGAAIGVHGDADGSARVGLFVISRGASKTLAFVELKFPPGQKGSIVSTESLGKFEAPPTASAVHYFTPAGSSVTRREAVVEVKGKGLLRLVEGGLRPVGVQGQPTNPILLVPGKDVTFVVYLKANGMPYLEPL